MCRDRMGLLAFSSFWCRLGNKYLTFPWPAAALSIFHVVVVQCFEATCASPTTLGVTPEVVVHGTHLYLVRETHDVGDPGGSRLPLVS